MANTRAHYAVLAMSFILLFSTHTAYADSLTLTSGSNATTTPNVATAITGFQIIGNAASTTPVKLYTTSGTLTLGTTSGLTFNGPSSGSVIYFSGTVADINAALSTLKYSRSSTGSDTLEVSLVNQGEVFFTTNNHLYKFISGSYTWNAAQTAAQNLTAYGATGYLATITSSDENAFIKDRLSGDGWIGASDAAVEGTWKWVTGPEAGTTFWQGTGSGSTVGGNYANWNAGEPNNSGGNENCAETYVSSGMWNDLNCTTNFLGYVAEFGAPGNLPTVVAKNISIVTADVPAITSLSPTNGASGVNTSSALTIGFSKSVSTSTGTILIRKTSDDSIVESINVATSSAISGSGSTSITIRPTHILADSTGYYVTIPSTSFKDGSNNFFDGISASTTWAFTTGDFTPPVITAATSSYATTTATVIWNTDEGASSKVVYSSDTLYASSTSETDTGVRVTSHSKVITNLLACTQYNYKVVSADAAGNYATSTSAAFTTIGCPGSALPTSSTSTRVAVNTVATTSVTDTGRTLLVTTPANFTATTSSVVIQIKGLPASTVLGSIGTPSASLSSAASIVFDVTALIDNSTVLDSFDSPVTISYTYTDSDIAGLDENSLTMYHYHNGAWLALTGCSVDTAANKITCVAPSFSTFAIFGTPPVVVSTSRAGSAGLPWCSGPSAPGWNPNLPDGGCSSSTTQATAAALVIPPTTVSSSTDSHMSTTQRVCAGYHFTRQLEFGSKGEDVRALQKFLNCSGFSLADSGPGSLGNETVNFSDKTKSALILYQQAHAKEILIPLHLVKGTGYFGTATLTYVMHS